MSNSDIWKVTITPRFVLILTPSSLPASLRYLQPPPPHPPKKTNLPLAYHEPHFSQSLLNLPLLTKSNLVSAFKSTPPFWPIPHPFSFISCRRLQIYPILPISIAPHPSFLVTAFKSTTLPLSTNLHCPYFHWSPLHLFSLPWKSTSLLTNLPLSYHIRQPTFTPPQPPSKPWILPLPIPILNTPTYPGDLIRTTWQIKIHRNHHRKSSTKMTMWGKAMSSIE